MFVLAALFAIFNYPSSPLSIDPKDTISVVEGIYSYHVRLTIGLLPFLNTPSSIINISSIYGKVSPDPSIYKKDLQMNPLLYGSIRPLPLIFFAKVSR